MSEKQITDEYVKEYLKKKMKIDSNCITCTFFDLKVREDLTDAQIDLFLAKAREILLDMNYLVYFTGTKFVYQNANRTVQDNELMIAIKEEN